MGCVVLNADAHGFGDAVLTAWISEGSKSAPDAQLVHFATGARRQLLEMLGQTVVPGSAGAVTTFAAYEVELAERGRVPRVLSRARELGIAAPPRRPRARIPEHARRWAAQVVAEPGADPARPLVLCYPQTAYASRAWPPACFVDLAWTLDAQGFAVKVLLAERDERFTNTPRFYYGFDWAHQAALMELADCVVGNDSGPVHLAGTLGRPTLALMGPTTPSVFAHMPSVEALSCRPEQMECVGCYFGPPFRAACDQGCQALFRLSPEAVIDAVRRLCERPAASAAARAAVVAPRPRGGTAATQDLVRDEASSLWIRRGRLGDLDRNVLAETVYSDGYYIEYIPTSGDDRELVVDVGAHIGCFPHAWRSRKNPRARFVCVEACPENVPVLLANLGESGTVLQAACTYEEGDLWLLNSVSASRPTATGGSIVCSGERPPPTALSGEYARDVRPLRRVTLEDVLRLAGARIIDVLKLDCEGSEFSILESSPSLARVRFIVGEYHDRDRFEKLVAERFADWDFGHMFSSGQLGIFHLRNRALAQTARP